MLSLPPQIGSVTPNGVTTHHLGTTAIGGALHLKLVWPEHGLQRFWCAVGVASNGNLTKSWYGKGKVGVAPTTPTIRHSPLMVELLHPG